MVRLTFNPLRLRTIVILAVIAIVAFELCLPLLQSARGIGHGVWLLQLFELPMDVESLTVVNEEDLSIKLMIKPEQSGYVEFPMIVRHATKSEFFERSAYPYLRRILVTTRSQTGNESQYRLDLNQMGMIPLGLGTPRVKVTLLRDE